MAVTFTFALILTACSSTTIVEQWADSNQKTAFNHLLVLSLNHSDSKRRVFESGFIAELDKRNIEATASYELLPDKNDLSTETIKAAIAGTDIDAALVMRQVRIKKEERYVQPRYNYMGDPFYGSFYGYYGHFAPIYTPGYVTEDTIVHLETNLYRVEGEKLVWSGKTETFNPNNTNTLISELAKTILNALAKSGLI
jgi:hypothetical protein